MKNSIDGFTPNIAPKNSSSSPRILVAGGIGDVYWVMVKIEAFCKREGIKEKPKIMVLAPDGLWESAKKRSIPFLEMIPSVTVGNPSTVLNMPNECKDNKYMMKIYGGYETKAIYPGFMGYEYFICYNGVINTGKWIEEVDDLACNWYLPLHISERQKQYQSNCQQQYGKYAVFYFSMVGDFLTKNMGQFSLNKMAESINHLVKQTNLSPVFIGASWDLHWPDKNKNWEDQLPILISKVPGAINLVGKTKLDEAFGVMRGAELISGYHCGLTNIGIMLRKPIVLLWATDRFPENTPLAVAPPSTRNTTYVPLLTEGLTIDKYTATMVNLYKKHS
jgi:hypothetical protein